MEFQSWEWQYVREIKPDKRRRILAEGIKEEGMSPANELRQKLMEARYGQMQQVNAEDTEIDYYIRGMMSMSMMRVNSGPFAKRRLRKEMAKVMDDWKLKYVEEYGSIGAEVVYQELCNMVLRYMDMCQSDANYSGLLLGMGRMSDHSLSNKIMRELHTVSYEIPKKVGMEKEMELFAKAAVDMFCEEFPSKAKAMKELSAE